ncbi:MAG: PDZ domain-containing protein [Candidatus Aegiribacteria sp.]|nr:PDZ domain-containing protein [Candidatus Aegiribacteria sp.]
MRISAVAVLLLVVINTVSGSTDSVYQYLEEDEFDLDITEFRELTSGVSGARELFEFIDNENGFFTDTLLTGSILYPDSVERHFYYAVPSGYDPDDGNPVFVWLHGGVSTPDLHTMEPEVLTEWYLVPRLLEEGYLIAFPCGQMDATWWDPVGEEGILRIVRWMKMNFNVDDSRIFVGGFSDGASGSFSLMMLYPSCFAGYLAFSGHIGVAAIDGERATYLSSLSNRPGIVSHSDEDGLYPTGKMAPTVVLAESAGAVIEYHTFQGFEHDPSYLPQLEERILEFMAETERERFPGSIIWEAGEPSGCDWLMVDSIIPWPLIGGDLDYNTILVSDRLRFGFYPDWEYEGDGVLISGVVDGDVPAARLGLQEGDVITGFAGEDIATLDDIGILQEGMLPGDSFSIAILRDGEVLEMRDRFNPAEHYWLLPRFGPSVRVEVVYSQNRFDITVNRFCMIRLLLHPEMVDFSRDVVVSCNGYEVFRGSIEEDGNFAMDNLMESMDLERCYTNELMLDLEELLTPLMYSALSN